MKKRNEMAKKVIALATVAMLTGSLAVPSVNVTAYADDTEDAIVENNDAESQADEAEAVEAEEATEETNESLADESEEIVEESDESLVNESDDSDVTPPLDEVKVTNVSLGEPTGEGLSEDITATLTLENYLEDGLTYQVTNRQNVSGDVTYENNTATISGLKYGDHVKVMHGSEIIKNFKVLSDHLLNGDFETCTSFGSVNTTAKSGSSVYGWHTTASDYCIELQKEALYSLKPSDGEVYCELNATQFSSLYQEISVEQGEILDWAACHAGIDSSATDTMAIVVGPALPAGEEYTKASASEDDLFAKIVAAAKEQNTSLTVGKTYYVTYNGTEYQVTIATDAKAWGSYQGAYTVPSGVTEVVFGFSAISSGRNNACYGNFVDSVTFAKSTRTKVAFSGNFDKTYDGKAVTTDGLKCTAEDGTTVSLTAEDCEITYYKVLDDGSREKLTSAPTEAGDYVMAVSVKGNNETYVGSTEIPFTISPVTSLTANATLNNAGTVDKNGNYTKTYDGEESDLDTDSLEFTDANNEKVTLDASEYTGAWYKKNDDGTYSKMDGKPSDAGEYEYRIEVTSGNYKGSKTCIPLTINPMEVEITFGVKDSQEYDGTTRVTFTSAAYVVKKGTSEVISEDAGVDYDDTNANVAMESKNVGTNKVTCTGFALKGAKAGNYKLVEQPKVHDVTVTPIKVAITGLTANDKVYDGTTNVEVSGTANVVRSGSNKALPDSTGLSVVSGTGTLEDKNVGESKKVTCAGFILTGENACNYELVEQPEVNNVNVTKAKVSISGLSVANKVYDGSDVVTNYGTPVLNGVVDGDQVSINTDAVTAKYNNPKAGNRKVSFTGFAIEGEDAANYELEDVASVNARITESILNAKGTEKNGTMTISWNEIAGADGYDVYAQYCNYSFTKKSLNQVKNGSTVKLNIKKINGKKLDSTKNYKVYVVAYKWVNGEKVTLSKSVKCHFVGSKSKKMTNIKSIALSKTAYTLNAGETAKISGKVTLVNSKKKGLGANHTAKFRFKSSDKKVVTVDKNGKITAVGTGKATIYVYARDGKTKKVTVTVK